MQDSQFPDYPSPQRVFADVNLSPECIYRCSGAAVSILGDVVYFATPFVYCSSSALSTILVSARLCRYRCDVDVILTEGSRAAHALRMRLLTGIFFCRVKARVKSFLWLNPSVVFTCDQNVFQLSYTNDVVT